MNKTKQNLKKKIEKDAKKKLRAKQSKAELVRQKNSFIIKDI